MNNSIDFTAAKARYLPLIEEHFTKQFDRITESKLKEAMVYSFFSGGKRLRPLILCASAERCGVELKRALPFAFAIECLHTQSLVHDDMPALDDDKYRRGALCCHVVYGQGTALLAGDALLNLAYSGCLESCKDEKDIKALKYISEAMGIDGLLGGQALELTLQGFDDKQNIKVYKQKTAALFRACFIVPLILADCDQSLIEKFEAFAEEFGILFQLTDDYLDTAIDELKAETIKQQVQASRTKCLDLCEQLGDWNFAKTLIDYVAVRKV